MGVLLLIAWTPPFWGMILLLLLGGWLGLVLILPSWAEKILIGIGIATTLLLFPFPTLGLCLIPLGAGWVGFFIGRYYHHKAEIMGDEHEEEDLRDV
ncbi:hypothetical protein HY339_00735 [Candidatus Gottesmanbacteria bacterium]|nr:hypothetical protein [Candidatus Gottesmanbacteria bacterium]